MKILYKPWGFESCELNWGNFTFGTYSLEYAIDAWEKGTDKFVAGLCTNRVYNNSELRAITVCKDIQSKNSIRGWGQIIAMKSSRWTWASSVYYINIRNKVGSLFNDTVNFTVLNNKCEEATCDKLKQRVIKKKQQQIIVIW